MFKRSAHISAALLCIALESGCGTGQSVATGATGPQGPAGPAGSPGITFRNSYSTTASYVFSDVVTYKGTSFFALKPSVNVVPGLLSNPDSLADWTVFAAAGADGAPGLTGQAGLPGAAGPTGATGVAGPAGIAGPVGPAGAPGTTGPAGPAGVAGPAGPFGAVGPGGAAGPQGPQGVAGLSGAIGPAGPMGPAGPIGLTGATGPEGPVGATGPAGSGGGGAQGPQGPAGATGPAGPMGLTGATGAAGPDGPVGLQGSQGPAGPAGSQGPPGTLAGSYLSGIRFGVQGDSLSAQFGNAWQNVVMQRTGMSLSMQDARSGRRFDQAFECWGNPPVGGVPGSFDPTYVFPADFGSCGGGKYTAFLGINAGMSFTDSLANVDLMIIDLGTNDQSVALGQLGDAVTANTFYGNMRWVVETYLNTKPTLRVVLVTTQYNRFATPAVNRQYSEATELYGNSVGIPVINMFKLGGVNANTESVLLRDSVHPSDLGFAKFYGPVIAQKLQSVF